MAFKTIPTSPNSAYQLYEAEPCEYASPIEYFKVSTFNSLFPIELMRLQSMAKSITQRLSAKSRATAISKSDSEAIISRARAYAIPDELKLLLLTKKKKEQQKLLKNVVFNTDLLVALPVYAWDYLGMPYSRFSVDHLPKELNNKVMPAYIRKEEDGSFDWLGHTDLTIGEMRAAIDKRNRVTCDFIGDENVWHCFYRTMAGTNGTEIPHKAEPHIHYISSAWGTPRNLIVQQLKSYRHSVDGETIPFERRQFLSY